MQIESLSLFLAVVESKSLTKASKQFCITPQGASASIRTLEKQLDTQLFVRSSGGALEPTKEGLELAKEAERVVGAYRSLQTVAAMQKSGRGQWAQLHVVVSPFVHQSIAFLIEEYVLRVDPELRTSIEVQSSFEIAKQFDKADGNTLYLIDLPLELKPFENSYPADFIKKVVFDRDYFKPFLLSSFRLICSDNSAYAKRASVKWSEIETEKLACHNDSFLLGVIGQQTNSRTATHAVPKSHQRQNHSFGTENITRCWYSRSFAQRAGRQAFRLCSTIPAAIFSNIRRRKRSRPFLQDQPPGIQQKATPEIILRSVFSFLYLVRHLNRFFTESANKLLFSRNLLSITLSVYRLFGLLAPIKSGWFWAGINRRIR